MIKGGINKSEAIRKYFMKHPDAKPAQVVNALAKRGIEVTPQVVSSQKFAMKEKGIFPGEGDAPAVRATTTKKATKKKRRKKRSKAVRRTKRRSAANSHIDRDILIKARKLAEQVGGIEQARKAIDLLADAQL